MRLPLTAATVLNMGSCFYEASEPLTQASAAFVDEFLVGTWQGAAKNAGDQVRIRAFDERSYLLEVDSKGTRQVMRAHSSEISGKRILNVTSIESATGKYMFFRYDWAGDTLVVRAVKDAAPPPLAGPRTLRTWLAQRIDDRMIYDDVARLVRR